MSLFSNLIRDGGRRRCCGVVTPIPVRRHATQPTTTTPREGGGALAMRTADSFSGRFPITMSSSTMLQPRQVRFAEQGIGRINVLYDNVQQPYTTDVARLHQLPMGSPLASSPSMGHVIQQQDLRHYHRSPNPSLIEPMGQQCVVYTEARRKGHVRPFQHRTMVHSTPLVADKSITFMDENLASMILGKPTRESTDSDRADTFRLLSIADVEVAQGVEGRGGSESSSPVMLSPERMEELLLRLVLEEDTTIVTSAVGSRLSTDDFTKLLNCVLYAWKEEATASNKSGTMGGSKLAEDHKSDCSHIMSSSSSSSGSEYAAGRAEKLLLWAVHLAEDLRKKSDQGEKVRVRYLKPDLESYEAVLDCYRSWSRQEQKHNVGSVAARKAEDFLNRMKSSYEAATIIVVPRPSVYCYNVVLDAYSESATPERAEKILESMLTNATSVSAVNPDQKTFNIVFKALARMAKIENASTGAHGSPIGSTDKVGEGVEYRAERWLDRMEEYYSSSVTTDLHIAKNGPNTITYSTVLDVLANSRAPDATERADRVFNRMLAMNQRPDSQTYGTFLKIWAHSTREEAPLRVESIIQNMEELYSQTGDKSVRPDTIVYNTAIAAWSRSDNPGALQRAESLLRKMQYLHESGSNPDARPNTRTYNTVINALAQSNEVHAVERAEAILSELERLHDEERRRGSSNAAVLRPNTITYSTVIKALSANASRDRQAAPRAEQLLLQMEERSQGVDSDVKPNTICYNAAIAAWSRSGLKDAPERAGKLLQRMIDKSNDGDNSVRPDQISYSSVLNAFSQVGDAISAKKAQLLLEHMEKLDDPTIRPDTVSYSTVMNAWAKSGTSDQAVQAWNVLVRMDKLNASGERKATPNEFCFNTVLVACYRTRGKGEHRQRALKIATVTLQRMDGHNAVRRNTFIYASYLNCIRNLETDVSRKEDMAETIFRECCQDGMVNTQVLVSLKGAAPSVYHRSFGGRSGDRDIPLEWKRNVKPSRRRPNKSGRPQGQRRREG